MAIFVPRFVRQLRDVLLTAPADGEVLTYDSADEKWKNEVGGGGGGPPTGAAGGVLGGTYPNPGFAVDMATQAELDAHVTDITDAHDATAVSVAPFGTIAATQVQAALEEIVAEAVTDLGPAVILAPATSARNVIQPTAGDVIAAIVKAHAAQSVDLTQWQDSAGAVLAKFTWNGQLRISPAALGVTPDETSGQAGLMVEGLPGTYNGRDNWWGAQIRVPQASGAWLYGGASIYFSVYDSSNPLGDLQPGIDMYRRDPADGHVTGAAFIYPGSMTFEDTDSISGVGTYLHALGSGGLDMYGGQISVWDDWSGTTRIFAVDAVGRIMTAARTAPADGDLANSEWAMWGDDTSPRWKGKTSGGVVVNFTPADATALADHIADTADAHDASAVSFSPTGTIAATDVQAAIAEVASEAGGGGAPTDASYVTVNSEAGLSAETLYTALKLDDFAAPDDNTDLNASTTKHGLLPKLSNVVTEFLNGTGAFSVPAGAGGASSTDNLFLTRYVCKR